MTSTLVAEAQAVYPPFTAEHDLIRRHMRPSRRARRIGLPLVLHQSIEADSPLGSNATAADSALIEKLNQLPG
jgi:hypothetical protein